MNQPQRAAEFGGSGGDRLGRVLLADVTGDGSNSRNVTQFGGLGRELIAGSGIQDESGAFRPESVGEGGADAA